MKIINFKTIEPFFTQERDGLKPFTVRKVDSQDKRFRALAQWEPCYNWAIRITNPATGDSFIRKLKNVHLLWGWKILILGELISNEGGENEVKDLSGLI